MDRVKKDKRYEIGRQYCEAILEEIELDRLNARVTNNVLRQQREINERNHVIAIERKRARAAKKKHDDDVRSTIAVILFIVEWLVNISLYGYYERNGWFIVIAIVLTFPIFWFGKFLGNDRY